MNSITERSIPTEKGALPTLPPEIWSHIFSYLPFVELVRTALVQRTWNAFEWHFITRLDLSSINAKINDDIYSRVVKRCPNLRKINLRGCTGLSRPVECLATYATKLNELDLSRCDPNCLNGIENLKTKRSIRLKLDGCEWLTDDALDKISESMGPRLIYISLTKCLGLTSASIARLCANSPNLTELNIGGCWRVNHDALGAIAAHCTRLESLGLSGKRFTERSFELFCCIENPNFGAQLKSLDLRSCFVSDVMLKSIGRHCPNVQHLIVKQSRATDAGIARVITPRLRALDLQGCSRITDVTLQRIGETCTDLRAIDLRQCVLVTDEGVSGLATGCCEAEQDEDEDFGYYGGLEAVLLRDCPRVTDKSVADLVVHHPNLRAVDLRSCRSVTDATPKIVSEYCCYLRSLRLDDTAVTDEGIGYLCQIENVQLLHTLTLGMCKGITDRGAAMLAEKCVGLRRVCFDRCPNLRDPAAWVRRLGAENVGDRTG